MPRVEDDEEIEVPSSTDDRMQKRIREALSYTAALAALAGIGLGIFEYLQRKDLARARQTMQQIEFWDEQAGPRESYRMLSRKVASVFASVPDSEVAAARLDPEGIGVQLREKIVEIVFREDGMEDAFDDVVYFFSRLSLCVEAQLCDETASKVFFEDTLVSFLDTFEVEIARQAESATGFGKAVLCLEQRFTGNACRDPGVTGPRRAP
ncbi:MAG: hypothetical protein AAFS01_00470 [Pseudomonadota bacterium]